MIKQISQLISKYFVYVLAYFTVFVGALYKPTDPDLGWHLKYGEYFFKHFSILRDNTFSTQMPNYHWANSSWVTDLITYTTYDNFGFFGLTIISALVIVLTFYFFARAFRLNIWNQVLFFPVLLFAEESVNALSFRGQQLTFLFIALLFFILSFFEEKKESLTFANSRKLWFLVPLFFAWVNIHGEFILGLGLLAIWFLVRTFRQAFLYTSSFSEKKKEILFLTTIFIACALASTINPFGIQIHLETIKHFGNPSLKDIVEYLPFDAFSENWWIHMLASLAIVIAFIFFYDNEKIKAKLPTIAVFFVLLFMSFIIRRYTWPMYYIALPLLKPIADYIIPEKKYLVPLVTFLFLVYLASVCYVKSPPVQYVQMSWNEYASIRGISINAAQYLSDNPVNEKMLTVYDWGGFLIWNFPTVKPSIDGRMHLWQDENGFSAFAEYIKVEQNRGSIEDTDYKAVLISRAKPMYSQMLQLVNSKKWSIIYQDSRASVFIRK